MGNNGLVYLTPCLLVLVLVPATKPQLTWEHLSANNTGPSPRQDAGVAYDPVRHQLLVFGGRSEINRAPVVLGDTWALDLHTRRWRDLQPSASPSPRYGFISGLSGDYYYITAGQGTNGLYLNDIWRFHIGSETWEELPAQTMPSYYTSQQWSVQSRDPVQPSPRYAAGGGIYANGSYLFVSLGTAEEQFSDAYYYDILNRGWMLGHAGGNPYNPSYPHARHSPASTMMSDHEMLVYGGCLSGGGSGGPCPSGDSWVYEGRTHSWTETGGCPAPKSRASLAMLPTADGQRRAVLYGGIETSPQVLITVESSSNQLGIFNPDSQEWALRLAQGEVPHKMASVAMATGDVGIYMFGGINVDTDELSGSVYLLRGTALTADQSPVQADCNPTNLSLGLLHGVLMTAGFGFFMLWGPFVARYCKHKRHWFPLHATFQVFGLLVAVAGLICACLSVQSGHFRFLHSYLGIAAMGLAVLQPVNAILRPKVAGSGQPRTLRRVLWEMAHRFLGRVTLVLGLVNISLGVFLGLAHVIVWALWFAYLALVLLIFVVAETNSKFEGQPYGEQYITHQYNIRGGGPHGLIMDDNKSAFDNATLESEGFCDLDRETASQANC